MAFVKNMRLEKLTMRTPPGFLEHPSKTHAAFVADECVSAELSAILIGYPDSSSYQTALSHSWINVNEWRLMIMIDSRQER